MSGMIAELLLILAAGPISKWDDRKPNYEFVSSANIYDAERCMMDVPGVWVPQVYRQPDRPNAVMLLWTISQFGQQVSGRMDLEQKPDGLHVKAWGMMSEKCLPKKL